MIKIYGSSDDLIEIEGDIREEFNTDESISFLGFSDGTLLSIFYSDVFWRIHLVHKGSATYAKTEATDEDTDYSDVVVLVGDIRWVVFGKNYAK